MTPDDQLRDIDDLAACLPELVTARRADAGGSSSPGPRVPLRLDVLAVLDDRERGSRGWDVAAIASQPAQ